MRYTRYMKQATNWFTKYILEYEKNKAKEN